MEGAASARSLLRLLAGGDAVSGRLVPREPPRAGISGRLLDLAEAARRLPAPDRRAPERFHEAKDELAAELRALAWQIARTAHP